ncbi:hypothetical protein HDU92_003920 [Lobulomyces angularis]|nr:hypothetical protein HDU92_003920 [Lobulomyces angularis]
MKKKTVSFNEETEIYQTYSNADYDRTAVPQNDIDEFFDEEIESHADFLNFSKTSNIENNINNSNQENIYEKVDIDPSEVSTTFDVSKVKNNVDKKAKNWKNLSSNVFNFKKKSHSNNNTSDPPYGADLSSTNSSQKSRKQKLPSVSLNPITNKITNFTKKKSQSDNPTTSLNKKSSSNKISSSSSTDTEYKLDFNKNLPAILHQNKQRKSLDNINSTTQNEDEDEEYYSLFGNDSDSDTDDIYDVSFNPTKVQETYNVISSWT